MAVLGKANISIVQIKDGEPRPMYFQWSKSETVFAPKDSNLWLKGSSFVFFGGAMIGNIPYKSEWISDWTKVAAAKTSKYKYLWCKLTEDSEPFLFTGYSGLGGAFLLTVDRTDYVINKRMGSSATTIITLTVSEGTYSPDYLVWTLNGETITPTRVADDENVYKIAIPYSATYTEAKIVVVPYADGAVISGVSASVVLTGTDETDYYSFFGQVDSLPSTTSGTTYLRGDSVFLTTDNAIYTFNGSDWIEHASSAFSDAEKVTILAKAQKTAFEYAEEHGLSQDYAYISTLITKYVYARAIGTELLKLEGEGKIIGGAQEIDDAGFLKALGVYIDSTGIARFTQALLNDCRIKGGTIEDIEITGELHNGVLWTNTKEEAGEEYSIGSVGSQKYYLGSEAKAKIKSLLANWNAVYAYSGIYAGRSFAMLFKGTSSPSVGYFNDNKVSLYQPNIEPYGSEGITVYGRTRKIYSNQNANLYAADVYSTSWTQVTVPWNTDSDYIPVRLGYDGKYFWAITQKRALMYYSADGVTWNISPSRRYTDVVSNFYYRGYDSWLYFESIGSNNARCFVFTKGSDTLHTVVTTNASPIYWLGDYFGNYVTSVGVKICKFSDSSYYLNIAPPSGYRCGDMTFAKKNGSVCVVARFYASSGSAWQVCYCDLASSTSWTTLISFSESTLVGLGTLGSDNILVSCAGKLYVFNNLSTYKTIDIAGKRLDSVLYASDDLWHFTLYDSSSKTYTLASISISKRTFQSGLNFLNSDGDVVCYESALGDYMQSQSLTLNNGSTALLNLPTTIPSDVNTYRRIPTLFDTSAIFRSLQSVTVAEYTIFDPSINAERVISAVSSAIKVSISPDSFKVDDVEKANSTWYIKNATAIVVKFTPLALAAGVETGSMNPKEGLDNVTLGAIRPYKAVRAEQVQADKFEGIYPLGSVYISSSSTDPTNYFGGTWTLVTSSLSLGGITLYMFKRTG